MAKLRKGQKLLCVPCGREILISNCGVSRTTIWCCGRSMKSPSKVTRAKATKATATKAKTTKKKASRKTTTKKRA